MKRIKRIALLGILCLILLTSFSKVHAASANIRSNKSNMKVGETATITVSANSAAWNLHVSGATSWSAADSTADGENASKTFTISFKPSEAGTYNINLSGDVTDGKTMNTQNISDKVTIKVENKTNNNNNNSSNNNNNNNNDNNNNTSTASSEATLSNLGITPHDFSGFRKAKTYYYVTVPNDAEKISIYASPSSSKASVSGTGSKSLSVGKNTYYVKVTAEDKKTTKTYTLVVMRKEKEETNSEAETEENKPELSTDATLSNFGISPKEYDFSGFKKAITSYSTTVPYEAEKISIYGYASDSKATVSGTGEKNLKVGKNEFNVEVEAEDKKTTKTYSIVITREEEKEEEKEDEEEKESEVEISNKNNSGIEDIKVEGYTVKPEFNPDIHEYNVTIPEKLESVKVDVKTSDKELKTEVAGDTNLKVGTNIITVLISNKKTDTTENYQIYVTIGEEKVDITKFNYEVKQAQAGIKKKTWITQGTIALIVILLIVFFIARYRIRESLIMETEDEYEENEEIENPYSLYKNIQEDEEEKTSKIKRKPKGKRFK